MGLDALLEMMEARATVTSVTPSYPAGVTVKAAPIKACTPVTPVTPENDHTRSNAAIGTVEIGDPSSELAVNDLDLEPAVEARRLRVLALLDQHADWHYAVIVETDAEPGVVIVHIGIRGRATGEIIIEKARYDPVEFMRCLDRAAN